jgi:hypothetical protein
MKKHSNTWLLILIILNLPPTFRYKTEHIIINLATPGPNSPGDIESFIQPLFEEMAMASEGIWMWDAVDSSYFVNHAHIVMALGDMLGSASGKPLLSWDKHVCKLFPRLSQGITGCPGAT